MKITDYPRVERIKPNNVLLIDGPDGTKNITAEDLGFIPNNRRLMFRNKFLGNQVTNQQLEAIRDRSFSEFFVGDYWIINNVLWRIWDMDYWINCGDQGLGLEASHLVIMPDDQLYAAQMNATNVTTGGYTGSAMRTTHLNAARNTIRSAFPNMILTKRQIFENAVTNGIPSAGGWFDSEIDLPNEINMYGSNISRPGPNGATTAYSWTIDKSQFALAMIQPKFILCGPRNQNGNLIERRHMWLRDPVSTTTFARVISNGNASSNGASTSAGVRPCFAIG